MKRRPLCKSALHALADRCDHDGRNAWPSVKTIGAEIECGEKTVARCLETLRQAGIIFEQEPPKQRRPRTWGINLAALFALMPTPDPHTSADLNIPDTHDRADLSEASDFGARSSAPHISESAPHVLNLAPHISHSAPHDRADDPVLRSGKRSGPLEQVPAPSARVSFSDEEKEKQKHQTDQSFIVLKRLAIVVLASKGGHIRSELVRDIKARAGAIQIRAGAFHVSADDSEISKAIEYAQSVLRDWNRKEWLADAQRFVAELEAKQSATA